MIVDNITQLIGRTPLLRMHRFSQTHCPGSLILAKLESFNPLGSAKDRVAISMIEAARREGKILPGGTFIEPTSGNTGIGLAMCCAALGYRLILTMPDTMSVERRKLVKALGAEVVLTPGKDGMAGAIAEAERLQRETPNSLILQQFENPANPEAHKKTTAAELLEDLDEAPDCFVATVGTGGTLTGVASVLKEHFPRLKTVAVEPAGSPVLSGGKPGSHGLQGIGAGFIPKVLDLTLIDEVIPVTETEAYAAARSAARSEGVLCGISSGAALHAAALLAQRTPGSQILTLLPDTGERYLSTDLFEG